MNTELQESIETWLIQWMADEFSLNADEIEPSHTFIKYEMTSVTATVLAADLENWLGCRLSPTLLWNYPTIEALAQHLSETTKT